MSPINFRSSFNSFLTAFIHLHHEKTEGVFSTLTFRNDEAELSNKYFERLTFLFPENQPKRHVGGLILPIRSTKTCKADMAQQYPACDRLPAPAPARIRPAEEVEEGRFWW
jgi:hypothetical protein